MDAKPFEERTVFKVGTPARVERIRFAPDFQMPPDADFSRVHQLQPDWFSIRHPFAGIDREHSLAADGALQRLDVDARGLDGMDRRYLRCIAENYAGGPVGVETMAAALGDERDVVEEVIEPYLLQEGFVQRTPRGRMLTQIAFRHLGLAMPASLPAQLDFLAKLPLEPEVEEEATPMIIQKTP